MTNRREFAKLGIGVAGVTHVAGAAAGTIGTGLLPMLQAPRDVRPHWIEKDQNPYHLRIYDCRPFTQSVTAASQDPAIARRFAMSRTLDGSQRSDEMPDDATLVPCRLRYSTAPALRDGPVFRARVMEEKWDIDFFAGKLYFRRSWTGLIDYVAVVDKSKPTLEISATHAAAPDRESGELAVCHVDFLVKTYLFKRVVPHRLPSGLPATEEKITVFSFSMFGRAACFACYEDTTQFAV